MKISVVDVNWDQITVEPVRREEMVEVSIGSAFVVLSLSAIGDLVTALNIVRDVAVRRAAEVES